ncbi:hypothetical protein [Halorubrum coriense]|uniref:hypothetical protein n=1 Tax=Halorubrum coriense TaxID=64713 RepID=UPI001268F07B|nr:hypothetical protein [Halorubrum coriense]
MAETEESTGLDVDPNELLTDTPVFATLVCGSGERVAVFPAALPEANRLTITPVDTTTTSILEQCSVTTGGLVDAVAHNEGIVEFRPDNVDDNEPAGPYYAGVEAVDPEPPARVTANTQVDVSGLDIGEQQGGVLSPSERHELYTTDLNTQSPDDEFRAQLRERLEASLRDLRLLAKRLPDDDIKRVFGDGNDGASQTTSIATDVVALCWLGFDLAGKSPEWRVTQGIERALYAHDEGGKVNLSVTRQPLLPAAALLDRFRQHGPGTSDAYGTLEHLWAASDIDPFKLYDVTSKELGREFALPPADLMIERLAYRAQARRFPAAQVMDVSTNNELEKM